MVALTSGETRKSELPSEGTPEFLIHRYCEDNKYLLLCYPLWFGDNFLCSNRELTQFQGDLVHLKYDLLYKNSIQPQLDKKAMLYEVRAADR